MEQRVAHESVAEPVAGLARLDDADGDRGVEVVVRLPLREAGQGDELVGVERQADDGDALEHLPGGRSDAADGVDVDVAHPVRLVRGAAGQLVDDEGDAAAQRGDVFHEVGVGLVDAGGDERFDAVAVERS